MALGAVRTNWLAGELVRPEDLNRIEGNAEAGAKPNNTNSFTNGLATVPATVFTNTPGSINHTSQTGRVLIIASVTLASAAAAIRTAELSISVGGINQQPNGIAKVSLSVTTGNGNLAAAYIVPVFPVGVATAVAPMIRVSNTGGMTITHVSLQVVDI